MVEYALLSADVPPGFDVDIALGQGLAGGALGAFLTTLVVGAILVAILPEYTERTMADVVNEPVDSFVYGLVCLLGLVLVVVVLFITIIGVFLALPLLLLAYLLWAVGGAIAYLAIGDRLVGHDDGWLKPLLVAAAISGLLAATGVGGIIAFCVGAAGFGAVLQDWLG